MCFYGKTEVGIIDRDIWTTKFIRVSISCVQISHYRDYYSSIMYRNMLPVLLAIGKNIPIVGDVISAFDGSGSANKNKQSHAQRYPPHNRDRQYNDQYEPKF